MTSIAEVQDEVCKVAGELEELSKRLHLEEDMPAAEKTRLWKTEDFLQQTALQLGQKELLLMQSGHHNLAKEILPQRESHLQRKRKGHQMNTSPCMQLTWLEFLLEVSILKNCWKPLLSSPDVSKNSKIICL